MKELFENWKDTKSALMEGLTPSKAKIVETCLENQLRYLKETAGSDVTQAGNIGNFQKVVLPMIRRIIPGTIASEIVGVQPMSGPVGIVLSFRFAYLNDATTTEASADVTKGDEAFANNGKMRKFYSGGMSPSAAQGPFNAQGVNVGGAFNPAAPFTMTNVLSGQGGNVSDMESFGGRNMGMQLLRQTVEAKTRRLQAKWTLEAMQDLASQHGMDVEAEVTQALSSQIVQDIDNEIVNDLIELAGTTEIFDMAGSFTGTPHFVGDRFAVLGVLINKVIAEIQSKIRHAGGSFIVVSPQVVAILQSASKSVFAPAVTGTFEGPNGTRLVGILNGNIKVYSFLFNQSFGTSAMNSSNPGGATAASEVVLVGHKGGNGETDTGYFYCPYIPLQTSNTIVDPATYNNQLSVVTRYGKATFTQNTTSLGNSADYYGKIILSNISFL